MFFGVVATVVLSLISVYIPTRDAPAAARMTSGLQQTSLTLPSDTGAAAGTSLDADNLNSLQTQVRLDINELLELVSRFRCKMLCRVMPPSIEWLLLMFKAGW